MTVGPNKGPSDSLVQIRALMTVRVQKRASMTVWPKVLAYSSQASRSLGSTRVLAGSSVTKFGSSLASVC